MHVIISDTSCLIFLANIDSLQVLQALFNEVLITPEIQKEVGMELPEWVVVKSPIDKLKTKELQAFCDEGEASAIALAIETVGSKLILDDLQGRTLARSLNLSFTGTLGLLLIAKDRGIITSAKEYFTKLKKVKFRISEAEEEKFLKLAGEY